MGLLRNQQFYLGVWGLVQTIVLALIPNVPTDVIVGLDALVLALLASTLIEGDIKGLVSRRVLMAAVAFIAVVLGWAGVADAVWQPIEAIALVLINAFAIRDVTDPNSPRNTGVVV